MSWKDLPPDKLELVLAFCGVYPRLLETDGRLEWGYDRAAFEAAWAERGIAPLDEETDA